MTNDKLYYDMLRIRMIEEEIARRYPEGKMRCPVHLSIGQEASAVGVCAALGPKDKMVSTHRSHAHYLAKGGSLKGLIGELYGKRTGCSGGNGGSMHLIDLACNFYGSTSIVGGTIPVGVGLAFADRLKGSDATTVICIGDAAVEEGVFHEAANFASLHNLRVIFALEDNQYSCYTHKSKRQPNRGFRTLAHGHHLSHFSTSKHVLSIFDQVDMALLNTPCLVEMPTWRTLEHCGPNNDDYLGYRMSRPQQDLGKYVSNSDVEKIKEEIKEAFEFTEAAPYPDESDVGKFVYANY